MNSFSKYHIKIGSFGNFFSFFFFLVDDTYSLEVIEQDFICGGMVSIPRQQALENKHLKPAETRFY